VRRRMIPPLATVALIFLLPGCALVLAQTAPDRVTRDIDSQSVVSLAGSVNPRAAAKYDIGGVNTGTKINGMTLYFKPSADQKSELDALVKAQQTPGSASYHKWITPAEYASRFGLSDNDLAKVKSWLEQQGFSVDRVSDSRNAISFSGTAGQVESAFQTEIHNYKIDNQTHFANATQIVVPAALSGVVQSVRNLDDFRPKPHARFRTAQSSKVSPNFTSSQSGNHYLTPKDVATIYDINTAYSAGYTGTGQSIAVVGQSKIAVSDIESFQSAAGLTVKDPTLVLVPNSGTATVSSGDEAESDLDLEYSGAIAKGATIYLVYVGNNSNYSVWDSIQYAVDTNIAPIITVSYGACEPDLSSSDYSTLESIMEQGASQGQSIIVSSGDSGSTGCYQDLTSNSTPTSAEKALAVDYPASSAYVTGLGGTEFSSADVSSSNTTYWESASGSDVISSAKSYIPEQVWNDDSSSTASTYGAQYALASGGGGTSTLTGRPSWQSGVTGISSGSYRLVPDISLDSSADNAGYLYCSSDSTSTGITGSCSNGFRDSSDNYLTVAGGTSFAAPIFAGMLALINQKQNSTGQGLINSSLYTLAANSTTYASAFHDITSGGNECSAGSSYCSSAGESKYYATTGYDEASGLGSVDLYNLLTAWPSSSASSLEATTTSLTAASSTPSSGASDVITITVASGSSSITTTPTGTLTVTVDGTTETSSLALSGGSATYTFSSTTSGSHVINATYSGNSAFAGSTGSVTVTIGSSSSSGSGGSGSATVTVTPSGGYTGTVDLSLSTSSTYIQNYACYDVSNATISGTSAVSETLTLYTGTTNCSSASVQSGKVHAFHRAKTSKISSNSTLPITAAASGSLGLLLASIVGWRFRRIRALSCMMALVALGFVLSGCGGSSSSSSSKGFSLSVSPSTVTVSAGTSGIPTGSYSLTIDGQDSSNSSLTATTSMTLVVD
jgi:subtilase family serine protease